MTRADILDAAKTCVCGEREDDYGTPENNFTTIAKLWNIYLGAAHSAPLFNIITPKDTAIMMALLKVARIANSDKQDSFVDLAGYAACAAELTHLTPVKEDKNG